MSTSRNPYRRYLPFLRPHLGPFWTALLLLGVATAAQVALPKVFGWVIDVMLEAGTVAAGTVIMPVFGPHPLSGAFIIVFCVLAVLIGLLAGSTYISSYLLALVGERVHIEVRQKLFTHLQRVPIAYYDKTYTGRIMARITTDADALWHLVNDGSKNVLKPALTMVVIIILLLQVHLALAGALVVILPLVGFLFARARKRAKHASRNRQEALADVYSRLQEQISAVRVVRIFGQGHAESQAFLEDLRLLFDRNMSLLKTYFTLGSQMEVVSGITTAGILCLGGIAVTAGQLTVGQLVQFYIYAGMLFVPVRQLVNSSASVFSTAEVALDRIFELLDTPEADEVKSGGTPCESLAGGIAVRNVDFGYDPEHLILKDVSLDIPDRSTIAFVGPSGVGKTTIVNLLCRFYTPNRGSVAVGGKDIAAYEVETYRRRISYVTQDSFLFTGTIAENIRYGNPGITQEQVEEAARLANAHEFIASLPGGYATELGERGVNLSGGQKQRINIARALVRHPDILIMDEPTSALDAESESTLLEALQTVFRDKTCIIIAHRLSTVMAVDRIFVFNEGRVAQQGTHAELADTDGVYKELCRKQLVGFGGSTLTDGRD